MQQDGKLNTEQRKALVKLVQSAYSRRIERQREQYNEAVAQVTREVKAELGVSQMDAELKELERRVKELEAAKERIGFTKYSDNLIPGSEAQKMIAQGASADKEKIRALESRMDKTISSIWTATELSEVKPMIDELTGE